MTFSEFMSLLRIVLSAPAVVLIIALTAFWLFRDDIRKLLARVAKVRFPGGEITTSQESKMEPTPANENAAPVGGTPTPALPQDMNLNPELQQRILDIVQAQRAQAFLWEYRYLNMYLVRHTQQVLDWLANLPQRTTVLMFDSWWSATIPTAQERKAILGALENHSLIQIQGELIEVTPKGREYIQWRGPLPSVAA